MVKTTSPKMATLLDIKSLLFPQYGYISTEQIDYANQFIAAERLNISKVKHDPACISMMLPFEMKFNYHYNNDPMHESCFVIAPMFLRYSKADLCKKLILNMASLYNETIVAVCKEQENEVNCDDDGPLEAIKKLLLSNNAGIFKLETSICLLAQAFNECLESYIDQYGKINGSQVPDVNLFRNEFMKTEFMKSVLVTSPGVLKQTLDHYRLFLDLEANACHDLSLIIDDLVLSRPASSASSSSTSKLSEKLNEYMQRMGTGLIPIFKDLVYGKSQATPPLDNENSILRESLYAVSGCYMLYRAMELTVSCTKLANKVEKLIAEFKKLNTAIRTLKILSTHPKQSTTNLTNLYTPSSSTTTTNTVYDNSALFGLISELENQKILEKLENIQKTYFSFKKADYTSQEIANLQLSQHTAIFNKYSTCFEKDKADWPLESYKSNLQSIYDVFKGHDILNLLQASKTNDLACSSIETSLSLRNFNFHKANSMVEFSFDLDLPYYKDDITNLTFSGVVKDPKLRNHALEVKTVPSARTSSGSANQNENAIVLEMKGIPPRHGDKEFAYLERLYSFLNKLFEENHAKTAFRNVLYECSSKLVTLCWHGLDLPLIKRNKFVPLWSSKEHFITAFSHQFYITEFLAVCANYKAPMPMPPVAAAANPNNASNTIKDLKMFYDMSKINSVIKKAPYAPNVPMVLPHAAKSAVPLAQGPAANAKANSSSPGQDPAADATADSSSPGQDPAAIATADSSSPGQKPKSATASSSSPSPGAPAKEEDKSKTTSSTDSSNSKKWSKKKVIIVVVAVVAVVLALSGAFMLYYTSGSLFSKTL